MQNDDIKKLKNIAKSLRKLNAKIKLISLLDKAKKEYESNNLSDCEKTCKEILSSNPHNSIALRGLGCIAQAKYDYKNAEKYYNKALENSNNKEIEYTLLGTIFYLQDNLEKALEYYNLAIDTNDDYDKAYEGRNQAMLEQHLKIIDLQDSLIKQKIF